MKKKLFFAAVAIVALASCSDNEFIGDNSPTTQQENAADEIQFGFNVQNTTRADKVGADAAALLGNKFYVTGVKGDGTGTGQTVVFKTYTVEWSTNTAGTTESNTSDWEYVGKTNAFATTLGITSQTIKYWDFSTTAYDFAAYSVGSKTLVEKKNSGSENLITEGTVPSGSIWATPISYSSSAISATNPATYEITNAYQLRGSRDDLKECYITDMKTVTKANYQKEVELQFRSLASKVRMAIYETVPGYSVQNVNFYVDDATTIRNTGTGTDELNNANATLFGTDNTAFYTSGIYTVSFPHIGSGNSGNSDHNKAHVAITGNAGQSTQSFSTLNYTDSKLGITSTAATFAGAADDSYYVTVLPNETGNVLEMRVNYDLVSDDGNTDDVIHIHGAKAFIPATYTKWMPNYAYTYIFKISDNTNGWTSTTITDPAGLYPITFDAVVLDPILADREQTTITTVATPSITTYQKGHVYTDGPEYSAAKGKVYAQVFWTGESPELRNDLDANAKLYTVAKGTGCEVEISEATVLDALNISGRNKLTLTDVTSSAVATNVTTIPGENGNPISVTEKTAAELTVSKGTYAFVYDTKTYSPLYMSKEPADFPTGYFTNADCATGHEASAPWSSSTTYYTTESYIYSAEHFAKNAAEPAGWDSSDANKMEWYEDPNGVTKCSGAWASGSFDATNGQTYYRKFKVDHKVYGVKVIKVED